MKNRQGGFADHVTVIVGILLCLLMIGFFRTNDGIMSQINFKSMMRLPCGLTYSGISDNQKIVFPLQITGYINECGWTADTNGAGFIQVLDAKGLPITAPTEMVFTDDSTEAPYPFAATLSPVAAPQTDTGQVVIKSNSGLIKIVPVSF